MVIHRSGDVRIALVIALVVAPGSLEAQRRVSLSPGQAQLSGTTVRFTADSTGTP